MMSKTRTRNMILGAMMTALTAILSQIQIPIGLVPVSLATFAVFLSGALLGPQYGALSQLAYLLLGAAGIPVFAGFTAGLSRLIGPTGGYIFGYVLMAWLVGLLSRGGKAHYGRLILSMVAGEALLLTVGTAYFMMITGNNLAAALSTCVVPFLPGDAAKIALAALVARSVNGRLFKSA